MARIDDGRLWRRLERLAGITEPDRPWTRRSFTPRYLEGREWLAQEFREAGLDVRLDAAGNLFGTLRGTEPGLPPILIGSHTDSVPSGGRFDGPLGVLAALEVAQSLVERGEQLRHTLEVCDFLAEEPSEFGLSCVGSRALAGKLTDDMLAMTRPDGMTLREAIAYVGGDPARLAEAARAPGSVAAYVEVHIEQGRVLESEGTDIGVVTDLASIRREKILVTGRADHAGATPMKLRADALVGAAAIVTAVHERAAELAAERPFVATVGRIVNWPNAANAVPGSSELTLEVRSADEAAVERFAADVLAGLAGTLEAHSLKVERGLISHVPPSPCDPFVQETIAKAAEKAGLTSRPLFSGAGHDGMWVSHVGPFGMIFVPCRDGRSHTPEEWTEPHQAAAGAKALAETVELLDAELAPPA
ncbi:Zn-dependent hydrolase [Lutibaculum baratangense]|uniref:N-carbamoyl-L-amino acid hydrolase n=1 Tax=Lutibaculum baratangense AMV1 TaxID=631454 RepID=V4THR0_9HYPH|nr:Zn-dependent hydrolase [Lutibaculum baratangense]ESR25568.1 N-carbamoyl-L-amino acid hydrolase [Lutibaculum baratangense AMV1]